MKKIDVINGLRGFAILGVIYQHLFWEYTRPGWSIFPDSDYFHLFPFTYLSNGWLGVNLFFVLSGFVLFLPYGAGKRRIDSGADFRGFYMHRAARLLPLYYVSVLIAMFLLKDVNNDQDFLKNLFLMSTVTFNFTIDMFQPKYNVVLWSLGLEVWFSLLFPFLILLARKYGMLRVFIITAVVGLVVRFFGVQYEAFEIGSPYHSVLKDSILGRLDDFVLGMLICEVYLKRDGKKSSVSPVIGFLLGVTLITATCALWDMKVLLILPKNLIPLITNVSHAGFYFIVMSLLLMGRGAGAGIGGVIKAFFTNRLIQVAGMMCYSLYVWHNLSREIIITGGLSPFNLSVYFLFLIPFSLFTYRYIEFGRKDSKELFLLA
jgi:peptidoglycan/LPS O-acetylase OafA/YrhL